MSKKVRFVYGMMVEKRNKYYVKLSSIIKTAFSILDLKNAQKTFRSDKKVLFQFLWKKCVFVFWDMNSQKAVLFCSTV